MTYAELITETLRRAGEDPTDPKFYSAADAKAAINGALSAHGLLTMCVERAGAVSLAAGGIMRPLSADFPTWLCALRLQITAGRRLDASTLDEFTALNPHWPAYDARNPPERYTVVGWQWLCTIPVPIAAVSIDFRYAAIPTPLAADGDIPEIPDEDHLGLIDYAIPRLRCAEGGLELAKDTPRLKSFLGMVQDRARKVRTRSQRLHYDNQPTERWFKLMEGKWLSPPDQS